MPESLHEQLFSRDPLIRLTTAAAATPAIAAGFLPPRDKWIVNAFGAANAWLVVVGPSPGTGPGGKVDRPVPPVFGTVLPEFRRFEDPRNDKNGFWRELFRLLRQGFRRAGLAMHDEDAALKLMMIVNLDTNAHGDGSEVTRPMLKAGLPRLSCVLDVTKPRLILALKTDVYEEIWKWWGGTVQPEQSHDPVRTRKQSFYGKSRWLTRDNQKSVLLVKILQHPSRATLYRGYETLFSDYIGDRIAETIVG